MDDRLLVLLQQEGVVAGLLDGLQASRKRGTAMTPHSTVLIRYGSGGWTGNGVIIPSAAPADRSLRTSSISCNDSPSRTTLPHPAILLAIASRCPAAESRRLLP